MKAYVFFNYRGSKLTESSLLDGFIIFTLQVLYVYAHAVRMIMFLNLEAILIVLISTWSTGDDQLGFF